MNYVDRKRFMLEVAAPKADSAVFDKVKQSAVTAVMPHFEVGEGAPSRPLRRTSHLFWF